VWSHIAAAFGLQTYDLTIAKGGPTDWFKLQLKCKPKERKRRLIVLFTFWWMIWKERNRRIFEGKERSALQLARLIQDEINLHLAVYLPTDP
jgi:hypothetical protein